MIREDYVSFEIAKMLKEKGFECEQESIFAMYNELGKFILLSTSLDQYYDYLDFNDNYIAATYSMTLKWLREKKIFVDIFHYNSRMTPYIWCIFAFNELKPQTAETYEEAEEAVIKYVLENWDHVNEVLDKYYEYDKILPKI